jgi:ribosomal-protein-alanine N-acetyltransferase
LSDAPADEDIETARLSLRYIVPEAIRAGLSGDARTVERHLGARVPVDLLQDPAVLRYAQAELAADPDYRPWSARAIILRATSQMVGHIRFHTRPDADYLRPYARNAVELGYVIFAAYRRRGYAREAVGGVMQWAQKRHGIERFVASVSPTNAASLAVIAKFGFRRVGEHVDAIDGVEHIYLGQPFTA